jgi:Ca2+-binding EF-hand superfamily protein
MNKTKLLMCSLSTAALVGVGVSAYAADPGQKLHSESYTKERFTAADTNGDGFLSKQEAAARSKRFEGVRGGERFDAADTNNDGLLSFEEAAARKAAEKAGGADRASEAHDKRYNRERFQEADTDGDGYVSRAEAAADKQWADKLGGKRFDAADADGDGKLSFEEAKEARMRERKAY